MADLKRYATKLDVPYTFPPMFPLNTLKPQRALTWIATHAPDQIQLSTMALFEAYWVHGQDISSENILQSTLDTLGIQADKVMAGMVEQANKDTLRQVTENAVQRGAFGAPTFFVGETLFWGCDRMTFIEDEIRKQR